MRSDDEQLNEIEELREQLAAANALLTRIHTDPRQQLGSWGRDLSRYYDAHLSAQPASPEVIDVSAAYEGNPDITMPASGCQPPPPTYHDRAVLDAMGRDMDRCRAGLKPEHAFSTDHDRAVLEAMAFQLISQLRAERDALAEAGQTEIGRLLGQLVIAPHSMRIDIAARLREELARHGLHVVTAADKAVLEACKAADVRIIGGRAAFWSGTYDVAAAELARREAKKDPNV